MYLMYLEVAVLVATLGLAGCYKQTAVLPNFRAQMADADPWVIDARPQSDKETEHLSLLATSCDYGVRRLGDEKTVPPRLLLLQQDLEDRLGPLVQGRTLTVTRYAIYFNRAAGLRRGLGSSFGIIGAVMSGIGSQCPKEKTTGGWYKAADVTTPFSPIIVNLEATFAGRRHVVRSVYSPTEELSMMFGEPKAASGLFEAIRKATNALAAKIEAAENAQ